MQGHRPFLESTTIVLRGMRWGKRVKLTRNELVFMLFLGRVKSWTPLFS